MYLILVSKNNEQWVFTFFFKWPFIYNGTLETLIWSNKKGNRCRSTGIAIFAWKDTLNYAYSPFSVNIIPKFLPCI